LLIGKAFLAGKFHFLKTRHYDVKERVIVTLNIMLDFGITYDIYS